MSIISKIFKGAATSQTSDAKKPTPAEYTRLLEFIERLKALLGIDKYLARSDYKALVCEFAETNIFFRNLHKSGMLSSYCEKNALQLSTVEEFLKEYKDIKNLEEGAQAISQHNEEFVSTHLRTDEA